MRQNGEPAEHTAAHTGRLMMMNGHMPSVDIKSESVTINTKGYASDVLQSLNKYRLEGMFTDAVLCVDQEEFACHRCLLAMSSPYFQATFSSNFQEGINAHINFNDISPWVLKRIIEYVYTGYLEISLANAQEYLRTGHMLQYPAIVDACCSLLNKHLHPSNCLGVREMAQFYQCKELESNAYQYALENFSLVIETDDFCDLSCKSLLEYLRSDNVDVPNEFAIWQSVIKWIEYDPHERSGHFYSLLQCIRLGVMSDDSFEKVAQHPLVKTQPQCAELVKQAKMKRQSHSLKNGSYDNSDVEKTVARPSTLAKDMLVVLGGMADYVEQSVLGYEPVKSKWQSLPRLPTNVSWCSMYTYSNCIYVTGGIVDNALSHQVWKFTPRERKWSMFSTMPARRARHTSAVLNGLLYITGGVTIDNTQSVIPARTIYAMDIVTGKWREVGENRSPRELSKLIAYKNVLYELGGSVDGSASNFMEIYTVKANKQVECTGEHFILPCESIGPVQTVKVHEHVYVLWETTKQMISLNLESMVFKHLPSCSHTHLHSGMTAIDGKVYILGGIRDEQPFSTSECFDIESNQWTTFHMPSGRARHSCLHIQL